MCDIAPISFTWKKSTISEDNEFSEFGIDASIGTPAQVLPLTPALTWNNVFVNGGQVCHEDIRNTCVSTPNTTAVYDISTSSSYSTSSFEGSNELDTPILYRRSADKFTDILQLGDQKLDAFPMIRQNSSADGGIGLGANSTLLNILFQQKKIPTRSFALSSNLYSPSGLGQLTLGGYTKDHYTGPLYDGPPKSDIDFPCPSCFLVSTLTWRTPSESIVLTDRTTSGLPLLGIIDPSSPTISVPPSLFTRLSQITNGEPTSGTAPLLRFTNTSLPQGSLSVQLTNGFEVNITSQALFTPTAYTGGVTSLSTDPTEQYAMISSWDLHGAGSSTKTYDGAIMLGLPFAASAYLVADLDRGTSQIARAAPLTSENIGAETTQICPPKRDTVGETAGVAVSVVLGVGAVLLAVLLAWRDYKRKRQSRAGVMLS